MKKLDWICIVSLLLVVLVIFVVSCFFFDEAEYRILMGAMCFGVWLVYTSIMVAYRLLSRRGRETLEIKLSRQGFNAQRSYHYSTDAGINIMVYIDFDSKQFASNQIYNYVIPFSRIASGRVEIRSNALNSNKSAVAYVISIRRKGSENYYDYIEVFGTVVENDDLSDGEEITNLMIAKYPSLKDIVELDRDLQRIIEINKSDDVFISEIPDGDWQKAADSDEIDYDPNENTNPNYTKPPFSDKKW